MKDETTRMATQAQVKDTLTTLVQGLKHPMTFAQAERIKKDKGTVMAKVQSLLDIYATPEQSAKGLHYINCNLEPHIFNGWWVNKKLSLNPGIIGWRPEDMKTFRAPEQRNGITGYELRKIYQKMGAMTVHPMEFWYKNHRFAPNGLRHQKGHCAWGTIFSDEKGRDYVPEIYHNDEWCWAAHRLDWTDWNNRPDALLLKDGV